MAKTIADKLKIKAKDILLTIHAPAHFKKGLTGLPAGVKIITTGKDPIAIGYNQVHWFVLNKTQLEKEMSKVMKLVMPEVFVWVYYPKGTSKIQTDLTRDNGWECLMREKDKLSWINLFSFDETWSIFGFRSKTDNDRKKEAKPKPEREIFNWVNPTTKEVRLPDALINAFKKNKKEADYFHSLAFSHKKEYIEWIVTAKKEETKMKRVEGTIERLGKQWKNPSNN